MYQSPITVFERKFENHIVDGVYKAVKGFSIDVDKEELLKALQYDRGQYSKGYGDGYNKAIEEFAKIATDKIGEFILEHQDQLDFVSGVGMGWRIIEEVEEELKKSLNGTQMEEKGE